MLDHHPLHPALYRPVLLGGVAPAFLFLEACAVFLLLFEAGIHLVTVGVAVFYCAVFHPFACRLSARDPQILELAARSVHAKDFYVAQPLVQARVPGIDPPLPHR